MADQTRPAVLAKSAAISPVARDGSKLLERRAAPEPRENPKLGRWA